MTRKANFRPLPALTELFPGFVGWPPERTQLHGLQEALRAASAKLQQRRPVPFYSQREIARFFRVPMGTVIRACHTLNTEGRLTCVRGSGMQVPGRKAGPRTAVRGVVGLPVWLTGFAQILDWRMFFMRLADELRRQHFAAELIFTRNADLGRSALTDRLLRQPLDYLLWFLPHPVIRETLATVHDHGIRVICVTDTAHSWPYPHYRLDHSQARREAVACWKAAGIRKAVIARADDAAPPETELTRLLTQHGIACRFAPTPHQSWDPFFASCRGDPRTVTVFDDGLLSTLACQVVPQAMAALVRDHRVYFETSVDLPRSLQPGLRVDAAVFDWAALATRIVTDLINGHGTLPQSPRVIESGWLARALVTDLPASEYA